MVLSLTFKSLINFEFIVCGIRRWSSLIFLYISVQTAFFIQGLPRKSPAIVNIMKTTGVISI